MRHQTSDDRAAAPWALMAGLLFALFTVGAICEQGWAATRRYGVVLVGDPPVAQVRNLDAGTNYSSLQTARTSDGWTGGDDIVLEAGQPAAFPGPVELNTNGIRLFANGNEITANVTGNGNAPIVVRGSGAQVVGPIFSRNTNTTGSAGRALIIDCNTNDIFGARISDWICLQQHAGNGISPITVTNTGAAATSNQAHVTFERCTFDGVALSGAYRDVFINDAKCARGRSRIYLVDCRMSGATSTGGAGGGSSNNVVSVDGDADVIVIRGQYFNAGGAVLDVTDTLGGTLYVFGAEVWGGGAIGGVGGEHHGGIRAQVVRNCIVRDCWTGIVLIPGQGLFATAAASVAFPWGAGFCVAEGNRLTRSGRNPPASTTETAGIRVAETQAIVVDNLIEDWSWASTNSSIYDAGILLPSNNSGIVVRNNSILRAHRGIASVGRSGTTLDCFNNVIESKARAHPGGTPAAPAAIWFTGLTNNQSALQVTNNTIMTDPDASWTSTNNYAVNLQTTATQFGAQRGYNTIWIGGSATGAFNVGAPAATDVSTSGEANRPLIDAYGRHRVDSPARRHGSAEPWTEWQSQTLFCDVGDLSTNHAGASNYWPSGSTLTVRNLATPCTAGNTATAVGASSITVAVADASTNDAYNGWRAYVLTASTGANQSQLIQDYDSGTRVATLAAAWPSGTPTGTVTYAIYRELAGLTAWLPEASTAPTNSSEIAGQYRPIHASVPTSTAGQMTLTLRPGMRTTSAAFVAAAATSVVILPPMLPRGGNTRRWDQLFLEPRIAVADQPWFPDMFDRWPSPVFTTRAAAITPGPLAELPPMRDFRIDRPMDGTSRGWRMRLDDVLPKQARE